MHFRLGDGAFSLLISDLRRARAGFIDFGNTMTVEESEIEGGLHAVRARRRTPWRPPRADGRRMRGGVRGWCRAGHRRCVRDLPASRRFARSATPPVAAALPARCAVHTPVHRPDPWSGIHHRRASGRCHAAVPPGREREPSPRASTEAPAAPFAPPPAQVAMIMVALLGLVHGATRLQIAWVAKPCGAALLAGFLFAGQMAEG
jgi:hypothetical protein